MPWVYFKCLLSPLSAENKSFFSDLQYTLEGLLEAKLTKVCHPPLKTGVLEILTVKLVYIQ